LLDAGFGIIEDLQSGGVAGIIGAVQKAGTSYNTFRGKDLRPIVNEEANAALNSVLRKTIPAQVRQAQNSSGGFVFPKAPTTSTTGTAALSQAFGRPVTIIPPTR
jgi:hypothetical protein